MRLRRIYLLIPLAAAGAGAGIFWLTQPLQVTGTPVRVGPAADVVYATGFVEAREPVDVAARVTAPISEVLLVLDANIGQNAIAQVKAFDKAIGVTGLVVTKLDGTAKGGVLAAISRQCPKPVRFIGIGEAIDDLRPFAARDFTDALFGQDTLA